MQIKTNLEGFSAAAEEFITDQYPFMLSKAFNDALSFARRSTIDAMMDGGIKGGPTRFTVQGLKMLATDKNRLFGAVYFEARRDYMREIMHGGTKKPNGKRLVEPAAQDHSNLTQKGNFRRNYVNQMMAYANAQQGAQWSLINGRRRNRVGSHRIQLGKSKHKQTLGIWDWSKVSTKTGRAPKLLVYLGRTQRDQRKTFDGPAIARSAFEDRMPKAFSSAFEFAMKSSIKRSLTRLSR